MTQQPSTRSKQAGPLSKVAAAVREGATTAAEISRATGLSASTVSAALDYLTRVGMMRSSQESSVCTECGLRSSCTTGPSSCGTQRGGLVTLTLLDTPPR
ncbi:helix-turn-helix domain-containing protein [Corynebacterium flavescens]